VACACHYHWLAFCCMTEGCRHNQCVCITNCFFNSNTCSLKNFMKNLYESFLRVNSQGISLAHCSSDMASYINVRRFALCCSSLLLLWLCEGEVSITIKNHSCSQSIVSENVAHIRLTDACLHTLLGMAIQRCGEGDPPSMT